ncbi:MAG: ABC transporter substrate-binding protein [Synergistaceae bacterium]|jgi:peptide/nickel transport system substrate-binding protein|nr:ABC transporter substrate-binding protein [Synergistaceae bacterium]
MVKRRYFAFVVFALVFGMCGAAAARDTLRVADQYDVTTMDPIAHNDLSSGRACSSLYDTLVFLDPVSESIVPGLAESWEFLSGTAYKFNLRRGVKFHNGEEMSAADVKYSFTRALTPAGAKVAAYSQNIKDVEIVDDYTVIIHLKTVDYSFFSSLTHSWTSIVNKKAVEAAGDNYGMNPVGTGPFKFVSWQKGNKYTLERFDDYWGPQVRYKTLEVRSIPEPTSRMIELESGGVDIAFPIANNDMKRVEGNENLVLHRAPQTSVHYMGFNFAKKPFDDIRVRRAISAALDTVAIQAAVWRGVGKVPRSLITASTRYSIDGEIPPHVQDVDLAKKLLSEAGIKGLKLEIWTNERKERVDMATIIQAQLQEIGISSEIKVLEWGAYLNGLKAKTHDLFISGWVSSIPDPNFSVVGLLETGAGSNFTFFSDPKLDELLKKGRGVPDGDERAEIYREMQLYINDQFPMVYLHNDESIVGTQKYVKGFKPRPGENHSFRDIYFEE